MARKPRKPKKKVVARKRGGASVVCPECGRSTHVLITRRVEEGKMIRRVRQCVGRSKHKFETRENILA